MGKVVGTCMEAPKMYATKCKAQCTYMYVYLGDKIIALNFMDATHPCILRPLHPLRIRANINQITDFF